MALRSFLFALMAVGSPSILQAEEWLTESRFDAAIGRPLIATADLSPLRPFLEKLARERRVAVLLDRRIDPGRKVRVQLNAARFDAGIAELAEQVGAKVSIVADTVYVGPPRSAEQLRTLVWLRQVELSQATEKSVGRRFELIERHSLVWDDLAEPRQLLEQLSERYGLTLENPQLVPHDVWARGGIAHANASEALLLLLMQFDLCFEWTGDAEGIRILPAPERVSIVREHVVPREKQESILAAVAGAVPKAVATVKGTKLVVDGTLEEHETIEAMLRGQPREERPPSEVPLSRQRFTLKMVRDPAGALLKTLQVQGTDVRFDVRQLLHQGVDLRMLVSMEVRQASIDQLLSELCRQVPGLGYRIEGETVFIEKVEVERTTDQ